MTQDEKKEIKQLMENITFFGKEVIMSIEGIKKENNLTFKKKYSHDLDHIQTCITHLLINVETFNNKFP